MRRLSTALLESSVGWLHDRKQANMTNSRVALLLMLVGCVCSYSYEDIARLSDKLFNTSTYRRHVKPVQNQSQPVQVNVSHTLRAVLEVNLPEGYIMLQSDLHVRWKDEYLVWNMSEFNEIQAIQPPTGMIWTPEVVVQGERYSDARTVRDTPNPAWVSHEGNVSIIWTAESKAKCNSDDALYPFDYHVCFLRLLSATYTGDSVEFHTEENLMDVDKLDTDPMWQIYNSTIERSWLLKSGLNFSSIIVAVTIKRKLTYATYKIFMIFSGLVILNMLTPFVPPESGERITLCITIFLSFIVSSDGLSFELPQSPELSLGHSSLLMYNFLNILTVVWSIMIVNINGRTTPVPNSLVKFLRLKPRKQPDTSNTVPAETAESQVDVNNGNNNICSSDKTGVSWKEVSQRLDKFYFALYVGTYLTICIVTSSIILSNDVI